MRPLRSFLLLLILLACFTGLHYVIPVSQFFPSINEFFSPDLLSSFFPENKSSDNQQYILLPDSQAPVFVPVDSISLPAEDTITVISDPLKRFTDSLRYSEGQVRIMYYGDSQIEGDRITSFLRHILREQYGGAGPGLFLPLMPVMYTKTLWVRSSSNWKRYNYLSYRKGEISHSAMGPLLAVCRYLPVDSCTAVPEKAFVRIRSSRSSDSASSEYNNLRIFYGKAVGLVQIVVKADNIVVFSDTLRQDVDFDEIGCLLNSPEEVIIEFSGKVSPDIYGISIESPEGIVVDNIPQRGSAGLEFTMVARDNLYEAFRRLAPDLFILHFGLNIVKNVRDDYSYYSKGLERQLSLLKELSPSTEILVVSLTDMAYSEDDSLKSYKNIPLIIDAQKRAALAAGVAFWDSYAAMGGESSVISWVENSPPLIQKDYVHLTYTGADTLSEKLVQEMFLNRVQDSGNLSSRSVSTDSAGLPVTTIFKEEVKLAPERSYVESILVPILRYNPDKPLIFSSAAFWLFFLLVLLGYSLVYKKLFIRNAYLFLISLFFYYKSGGLFLSLLIFITLIDFTCGLLIHRSRVRFVKKIFVLVSIISNLGILAYFKYTGFFIESINQLFNTDYRVYDFLASFSNAQLGTSFEISNIILPVGISFFTFQSLSYIFDLYRGKMPPVKNIIDFGFFVSFFPQLVAGPIVRASEFIPQIYNEFRLARREFSHALFLISKGLIKKVIISDYIATNLIDRVFDSPAVYSGFENLMAVYGYGLQIYCDFSGYTDIAIGVALLLGFRLPINFNSPYKASGVSDFWKRWHISLSRWLKDYLYIPLGGNRRGKVRTTINLIITMLLGGLWHGASLMFVIWGLLHGIGLVINRIWNYYFGEGPSKSRIGRFIAVFITFHFVTLCWIFFRAIDIDSVETMMGQIIESFSPGSYLLVIQAYSSVILLILAGYIIHFLPEKTKEAYRGLFIRIPLIAQLVIIFFVAILLYQMRTTDVIPFIYFRF